MDQINLEALQVTEGEHQTASQPPKVLSNEELFDRKEAYVWWPSVAQVMKVAKLASQEQFAHHIAKALTTNDVAVDTNPRVAYDSAGMCALIATGIQGKLRLPSVDNLVDISQLQVLRSKINKFNFPSVYSGCNVRKAISPIETV